VIEVVLLLLGDLDRLGSLGQIGSVYAHHVHSSVLFAWHEEAVGDDDGALTEDIRGNSLDVVGPLEAGGVELDWIQV